MRSESERILSYRDRLQSISCSHLDTWDGEVTRSATRSIGCFLRSQCGLVIEKKRETGWCDINRKVVYPWKRRDDFRETKMSHEVHAGSGLALGRECANDDSKMPKVDNHTPSSKEQEF